MLKNPSELDVACSRVKQERRTTMGLQKLNPIWIKNRTEPCSGDAFMIIHVDAEVSFAEAPSLSARRPTFPQAI